MTWNYFATSHGKGEVSGARALLKQKLWKKHLKPNGMKIQNAHEVVSYLRVKSNKYHASHPCVRRVVNKYFWEVKEGDIDRTKVHDCATVKGSHKAHQV
jgi:hypothetical protein